MDLPTVFVGLPTRGVMAPGLIEATHHTGMNHKVKAFCVRSTSLLTQCFNTIWAEALNCRPFTHFVMLHDDIAPAPGWIDTLLEEKRKSGADILSVCVPIKDERGQVSTSVVDPVTMKLRRLCLKEVHKLPKTFDAAQAGFPGHWLLVNSGCWICDFTRPWVEEVCFQIRDRIRRREDGRFQAQTWGEDYGFSAWAHQKGLRVCATTAIPLVHFGLHGFPNNAPWGTWETDPEMDNYWFEPKEADMIDREAIEKGITDLEIEKQQALITVHRCEGAQFAIQQLLAKCDSDDDDQPLTEPNGPVNRMDSINEAPLNGVKA